MNHPALDDFGDLEAAAADAHVTGCEHCQAELAAQQEVRALLAALPDPGPVPADVVDRIENTLRALLAAEPIGGQSADAEPVAAASTVVPLGSAPSARRRQPWLAAAAAAVVLAGGAYGLTQVLPGGGAASSSAGAAASLSNERSAEGQVPDLVAPQAIASGLDYSRADLAAQVDRTMGTARTTPFGGAKGVLSTPAGVAACLSALGAPAATPMLVDVARFEGKPAAIVVLPADGGGREIWVVSTSCTPGQDGTRYFTSVR